MGKRILLINANSIFADTATGITLRSLFDNNKENEYMELFWYADGSEHKTGSLYLRHRPLSVSRILLRMRTSKINTNTKKESSGSPSSGHTAKAFIRQYLSLVPDREAPQIKAADYEQIDEFDPEVIYTLGASINALKLAYGFSVRYNVPIVIHHMDNWMHSIQWESNPLLKSYARSLRNLCLKCYSRSNVSIAISEEMAKAFSEEYGVHHVALMNSIDVNKYYCGEDKHDPIRFVYAGGLHLNRYAALLDVSKAIEELNANSVKKAELVIYTGQNNIDMYGDLFAQYPSTHVKKAVPHDQILDIYKAADILIHVEADTFADNEFSKYSVSTKIPEYLSTGKPVLYYGPDSIESYRFLKEADIAYTADCKEKLKECVISMIRGDADVDEKGEKGRAYARAHFDISQSSAILNHVFDIAAIPRQDA